MAAAKSEAAVRQVSVSKLVSDYFRNLFSAPETALSPDQDFAPRTRRVAGCIVTRNTPEFRHSSLREIGSPSDVDNEPAP